MHIGQKVWFVIFNHTDAMIETHTGQILRQYGDIYEVGYSRGVRLLWVKRLFLSEDELLNAYRFLEEP